MSEYTKLKERQQAEVNAFPIAFAFNEKQFEEAMKKLGLDPSETDKVYRLGNTGGIYRRSDSKALLDMMHRHRQEFEAAVAADETGDGFIYDMFSYELANHEFCITNDPEPTLDALGMTIEEVRADTRLLRGYKRAAMEQGSWLT